MEAGLLQPPGKLPFILRARGSADRFKERIDSLSSACGGSGEALSRS